jgi:multiple sugar transport system permease protein
MAAQLNKTNVRKSRKGANPLLAIFMVAFLCYFLLPLLWLIIASTKTNADLFGTFGFWFGNKFNLFQNLKDLFAYDKGNFLLWMKNTAIYAVVASLGSSLISTLAGYTFAKYEFAGRKVLFAIVLASMFVPTTVFAVPLFLMMSKSGLSNSLLAVILPTLINPFGVYLMRIYAEQAVSQDILDAARVDGAGEIRIFTTIVFRLLAPAYVTVLLFAFVGAWNNYFLPLLLLSKSDLFLLTVGLGYWNGLATQPGNAQVLYALVITGSLVAIIPVMLVFLYLQRYWQGGLSLGSVKE